MAKNRADRRYIRRKQAEERQTYYKTLTVDQKIDRATARPGKSKKELARLERKLAEIELINSL